MCFSLCMNAQNERIKLSNPSFEDMPRHSQPPMGWYNCGMEGESPPDVQPGAFEVNQRAINGMTYLGLVTRDNETWEAVGQRLSSPLKSGSCYQFRIYLSYSDEYFSISRTTLKNEFFIKPVLLRVWGGNGYCDKRELLAESAVVKSTTWEEHTFDIKSKRDYKYIVFEAFYKTPTLFPYNGNLLVDHASDIIEKDRCDDPIDDELFEDPKDPAIAINIPPTPPRPDPNVDPDPVVDPNPIVNNPPVVKEEPKIMTELDPDKIREGQTIRINKLDFKADGYKILEGMDPVLDEIYAFMIQNPNVIVEIGGHTNRLPSHEYCNWLSKNRASAVRDHLVSKGLSRGRIAFKGYGKTEPVDISNTPGGRRKNQRVEIKILSLKG
jgi:outer membrane protein OmpA-like peptidoglycan-associated protein